MCVSLRHGVTTHNWFAHYIWDIYEGFGHNGRKNFLFDILYDLRNGEGVLIQSYTDIDLHLFLFLPSLNLSQRDMFTIYDLILNEEYVVWQ